MNIEFIVQDSKSGKGYELSEIVSEIVYTTTLGDQPGKLTFQYLDDSEIVLNEGSVVSLKVGGKGVFFGYTFMHGEGPDGQVSITAYDQMRYLKNKDTYVLSNLTASQIFSKLCKDTKLKHRVVEASSYRTAERVNDNKSLFEIVQYAIDETLANTGEWYTMRDNFGTIEFRNIKSLKTDIFIGDESLLTDFEYKSSIDNDSFNQIKLVKDNKETGKRDVFLVKDSKTIAQWGLLQYFEKVDEKMNDAQIREKANQLLKLKNRVTKTLKLISLGDLSITAGSGVVLGISQLEDSLPKMGYYIVADCTHRFINDVHTMELGVQMTV